MLFKVKFFDLCLDHRSRSKERSLFCLNCGVSFCILCTNNHSGHRILQIQKYNSQAAVRTEDLFSLLNCSLVQRYTLNTAYVFSVKAKPTKEEVTVEKGVWYVSQATTPRRRPFEIFSRSCSYCSCSLKEEYKYCSLSCKVSKLLRTEGSILRQLRYRSNLLPPSNPVSTGEQFSTEANTRALTMGKSTRLRQLRYRSNLSPPSNPASSGEQFSAEANTRALTFGQSTRMRQLRCLLDISPPSNPVSSGEQFSAEPKTRALTIGQSTRIRQLRCHSDLLPPSNPVSSGENFSAEPNTMVLTIGKSTPLRQLRYRSNFLPPSNPVSSGEQSSAEPNTRALTIGQSTRLRQHRYCSDLSPPSNPVSISNGDQFSAEPNTRTLTVGKSTHSMQNDTEICEFARKKKEKNREAASCGSVVMRRRKGVPHRSPSNPVSSGKQFSAEPNTRALAIGQLTRLRQLQYSSDLSPPLNPVSISNGEQFSVEPNTRALSVAKSTHSMQNDTEICEFARKKREEWRGIFFWFSSRAQKERGSSPVTMFSNK